MRNEEQSEGSRASRKNGGSPSAPLSLRDREPSIDWSPEVSQGIPILVFLPTPGNEPHRLVQCEEVLAAKQDAQERRPR